MCMWYGLVFNRMKGRAGSCESTTIIVGLSNDVKKSQVLLSITLYNVNPYHTWFILVNLSICPLTHVCFPYICFVPSELRGSFLYATVLAISQPKSKKCKDIIIRVSRSVSTAIFDRSNQCIHFATQIDLNSRACTPWLPFECAYLGFERLVLAATIFVYRLCPSVMDLLH